MILCVGANRRVSDYRRIFSDTVPLIIGQSLYVDNSTDLQDLMFYCLGFYLYTVNECRLVRDTASST